MQILIGANEWDEAFHLAKQSEGKLAASVYLPYAEWLGTQDRFDEAQEAYVKAGREDLASKLLEQLTHNAVVERRFKDAGHYFWLLAQEISDAAKSIKSRGK